MHSKYRFIGIRPFKKNENNLFFERENITEKILKSLYFNQITLIHSKAGYGKTSIINAGILPKLEEKQNLIFFYISIPNFIKNSKCNLSEILFKKIDIY
jgi:ATP/maltotriose-dependent transcriptional regulator MalT